MKQEVYDVVVIGSGIGGMSAASLLTHEGYRTLVVERLPQIGGRFSTVEYKGFKLPTGALEVEAMGLIAELYSEVGAGFEVRPLAKLCYRIGGEDVPMLYKGGLRALLLTASEDEEVTGRVMAALKRGMGWEEPSNSISFREWLSEYSSNEKVLGVFQGMIASFMGINAYELPAGEFIRWLKITRSYPAIYGHAPKGNLALMESLAKAMRAQGGEIWTRCETKQILVTDEVARGVVVQTDKDEMEIASRVVISNAGPQKTVELAGSENFDKGYLKQMKESLRPASSIMIHTVSDRPLLEHADSLILTEARRVNWIACPTEACPELAPPGKHLMVSYSTPAFNFPPYDFAQEIAWHLQDLKENIPHFGSEGDILAVNCFHGEWPAFRTWLGYDLPQKTPIENLYNVGDAVKPSGRTGLPASVASGRMVVEDVKSRIKPGEA